MINWHLVRFLSRMVILERNLENEYNIVCTKTITSPSKSSWYNKSLKNLKIDASCKILPSLGNGKYTMVHHTRLDKTEPTDRYFSISKCADNYDMNVYKDKEMLEAFILNKYDFYALTDQNDKFFNIILGGSKVENVIQMVSKKILEKEFTQRYKILHKLKSTLESGKAIKMKADYDNAYMYKNKSYFLYINEEKYKKFDYIFTRVKQLLKTYKKGCVVFDGFDLIAVLADAYGVQARVNENFSIDNGWGSYTYTTIHHVINIKDYLSDKDLYYIKFYLEHNFGIDLDNNDYYFNDSTVKCGMIPRRGGYTHVS